MRGYIVLTICLLIAIGFLGCSSFSKTGNIEDYEILIKNGFPAIKVNVSTKEYPVILTLLDEQKEIKYPTIINNSSETSATLYFSMNPNKTKNLQSGTYYLQLRSPEEKEMKKIKYLIEKSRKLYTEKITLEGTSRLRILDYKTYYDECTQCMDFYCSKCVLEEVSLLVKNTGDVPVQFSGNGVVINKDFPVYFSGNGSFFSGSATIDGNSVYVTTKTLIEPGEKKWITLQGTITSKGMSYVTVFEPNIRHDIIIDFNDPIHTTGKSQITLKCKKQIDVSIKQVDIEVNFFGYMNAGMISGVKIMVTNKGNIPTPINNGRLSIAGKTGKLFIVYKCLPEGKTTKIETVSSLGGYISRGKYPVTVKLFYGDKELDAYHTTLNVG